jgi:hypothetical protein
MRRFMTIATILAAALSIPALPQAATIGGFYYATQYDYREFYWIADGKPFHVIMAGNPFPAMAEDDVARQLLPVMQANKPRPALTFTYQGPAEPPHPYYRFYLIADPANDLLAASVCATGQVRHKPGTPGKVYVMGLYCRNELPLSFTTAWTDASGPTDPAVGQLFKDLFAVVFSDSPLTGNKGDDFGRR